MREGIRDELLVWFLLCPFPGYEVFFKSYCWVLITNAKSSTLLFIPQLIFKTQKRSKFCSSDCFCSVFALMTMLLFYIADGAT